MKQHIHSFIIKEQLLLPTDKVIVALSGGADSVALLHILISLGYDCIAAHCNFHLRAEESDRDMTFVVKLCKQLNTRLFIKHFDTKKHARENKISIEMAARNLRYEWFNLLIQTQNAQKIAVAHHADDQAETILMNLVRGSGLRGLCGMPIKNKNIVRPLLCCTRNNIENYIKVKDLSFVNDSTNAETIFKRNKFRHEILPLLETINPNFRQTLLENRNYFEGYWQITQEQVQKLKAEITHKEVDTLYIDIEKLNTQLAAETLLYEILCEYQFNSAQITQLYNSTKGISGKIFQTNTHIALKDRKYILIKPNTKIAEPEPLLEKTIRKRFENEVFPANNANIAFFDATKLKEPLTLRKWQKGDSFKPLGMKGNKKISDFFTDQKLNILQKQDIWLLLSDNQVAWIIGHRIDDRFKITKDTEQVIAIRVRTRST